MSMYPKPPGQNDEAQNMRFFGNPNLDGLARHFIGNLHRLVVLVQFSRNFYEHVTFPGTVRIL